MGSPTSAGGTNALPISPPAQDELVKLLRRTGAVRISEQKEFRLASGEMSDHYFDLRLLCGDPAGIGAVAAAMYDVIRSLDSPAPLSVGGIESGSISIAAAVSHLSGLLCGRRPVADSPPLLPSFFVRKNRKQHGTQRIIEGVIRPPAVIVEDVVTSGGSALRAVEAVRGAGYACDDLLCIVFRGSDAQQKEIEETVKMTYLLRSGHILGKIRGA